MNLSKDEPEVKKRKLADSVPLDPTDPHFAIQENDDGEVSDGWHMDFIE